MNDRLIEEILRKSKTIAMVGVSSIKEDDPLKIKRRPSTIVMKYLQEFGYRVIPVNPFSAGKKIYGETVLSKLEEIKIPIDIVDVFRPSKEAAIFTKKTFEIGAKVVWFQYGIESEEAEKIAKSKKIIYIANKCIKQEYQRLFLKTSPVFPVLKN